VQLRDRFREFIGKMSEAELATRSLPELAGQLHCSERHFSRLFREEFNVSLRDRQTELRLQRARQLLAATNAKIINVAYESGYRHLGLFNQMFKRRFGLTPSAWRQKNLTNPPGETCVKRVGLVATLLLAVLQIFFSPDVGAAPAETVVTNPPPAVVSNAVPHFKVEKYLVSGNTILPPEKMGVLFTNVPTSFGTNVTFADIKSAIGQLQTAYRERGFVTVSVGLPPQKLTNGVVKVKVTEGRLADIKVQGNNWYSTPNVLRALPSLHTNMLLNSHVFQRELDLANANRDRQVYPVIGPGLEPGTSELTLKVKDRLPLHGRVEYNNTGTPGTPTDRTTFNASYGNLWQLEHQVGVQYTFTPLDYKSANPYGLWGPDLPLIANYSAYYRMPLGPADSIQQQIDQSNGKFGYNEVTHQFQMPPPSGRPELTIYGTRSVSDTGVQKDPTTIHLVETNGLILDQNHYSENVTLNEGIGLKLSMPLPQIRSLSSTLTFGLDYKHYESRGVQDTTIT
ncbi:MAG TPA: helix-turn-helix domain-containing protein, partial [Verrucomicrobiae bacterium]